jgi:DNA repair protein RecN (Recombination protein N)
VVAKRMQQGSAHSEIAAVTGEARVAEIARMLGGQRLSGTSLAHAQEMLASGAAPERGQRRKRA